MAVYDFVEQQDIEEILRRVGDTSTRAMRAMTPEDREKLERMNDLARQAESRRGQQS